MMKNPMVRRGVLVSVLVTIATTLVGCGKMAEAPKLPEVPDPGVTSFNGFKELPEELDKINGYVSQLSGGPATAEAPLGAPPAGAEGQTSGGDWFQTNVMARLMPQPQAPAEEGLRAQAQSLSDMEQAAARARDGQDPAELNQ